VVTPCPVIVPMVAAALAVAVLWLIVYRQLARLKRRHRRALQSAEFWTAAWTRDVRSLLRLCDEQEQQLITLNSRNDHLRRALRRANRRWHEQQEQLNESATTTRRGSGHGNRTSGK
jgi:biopolymer transport protein ExbB/TolQ